MADSLTFDIKIEGIEKLIEAFALSPQTVEPRLQDAIVASAGEVAKHRDGNVPIRTGSLINRWHLSVSRLKARYFPTSKYAVFVHEGTKPHTITAKNGKALAIPITGAYTYSGIHQGERRMKIRENGRSRLARAGSDVIFRRSVHHPGTKPNRFMPKMIEAAEPAVRDIFRKALDLINKDLARK